MKNQLLKIGDGMVIQCFLFGNAYDEYIKPDGIGLMTIPLLYGNHRSLDPGTYKLIERPSGKTWPNTWQIT